MTEKWMYQYPSTSLTRSHAGDRDYAVTFRGEADKLLYQLKNLMTFQKLGQLKMIRVFTDGTIITASSHFGYDSVKVDVSKSTLVTPSMQRCTITFTYFNAYLPPMRYPGEVRTGEEEGIDYVKSYYTVDTSYCPSCEDQVEWEFTFNYATEEQIDYYDAEPNNHCVYSQDQGCSGEIIEQDRDDGGDYIIWKVYTEASSHNRSGLGYAQFYAMLKNKNTEEIVCEFDEIIGVDCCEKDSALRDIDIWWEKISPGNSISYGGLTLYKVPASIDASDLDTYIDEGKLFYALTEDENGSGCLPFEWTLTGYGVLSSNDTNTASIGKEGTPRGSIDETILTVTDRCGSTDSFEASPCCDDATALYIDYTGLIMACGTKQDLEAMGGCPSYIWALSGGGSLSTTEGKYTTYTAPDTNENCLSHPTITLTDGCSISSELKLTVNCSPDTGIIKIHNLDVGTCTVYDPCDLCHPTHICILGLGSLNTIVWDCDGNIHSNCTESINIDKCRSHCTANDIFVLDEGGYCGCSCPHAYGANVFDTIIDSRTDEQKADGCCPINPFTGLPM